MSATQILASKATAAEPATRAESSIPPKLDCRERFLRACACQPVDRPPVWLMRQAGRCLPEYRALKEKYTFVQLVQNPELATEVTLQPVRRFGFDAAILFSDILVVPEALGCEYDFADNGGIRMRTISTAEQIAALTPGAVLEKLGYVPAALKLIRKELGGRNALIGFSGSPWTLANYMLEGSAKEFSRAKQLLYTEPVTFNLLLQKITTAVTTYLQMQIDAGVDAIQLFDSCGGALSDTAFGPGSSNWIKQIITNLKGQVPVIVFSKGTHGNWDGLVDTGANILGLDWTVNAVEVWSLLPRQVGVQGNLDPFLLTTTPEIVSRETAQILGQMKGFNGHIFNLGHGVPPAAKLENIEALVTTVQNFK